MLYNLLETVKDYDGKEVVNNQATPNVPTTTWQYIVNTALNSNIKPEDTPDDKAKMFAMTIKAYQNPQAVEFSADEVAFLLKRIKVNFFPLVIGRAEEFFNQTTPPTN